MITATQSIRLGAGAHARPRHGSVAVWGWVNDATAPVSTLRYMKFQTGGTVSLRKEDSG